MKMSKLFVKTKREFPSDAEAISHKLLVRAGYIKKLSRFTFIKLVKKYKNGTYVDDPKYYKYVDYKKCKKLTLKAYKDIAYCLDGECETTKEINVEIIEKAINFVVPNEYN